MSKSVNVDFVTRQIEVDTDGKEYYVSAAVAAKDAKQSMLSAQNAATLAEVQADSVKKYKSLWFDSVAAMKAEPSLTAGAYVNTAGYYEPNDGGGASYLIRAKADVDIDDGGSLHELSNGLVAELIIENGTVNVKQFGAKGDGVAPDDDAVAKAVEILVAKDGGILYFPIGTYLLNTSLIIPYNQETTRCMVNIVGEYVNSTEIKANHSGDAIKYIGTSQKNLSRPSIKSIRINGSKIANNAIYSIFSGMLLVHDVICKGFKNAGIYLDTGSWMFNLNNCYCVNCGKYGVYIADNCAGSNMDMVVCEENEINCYVGYTRMINIHNCTFQRYTKYGNLRIVAGWDLTIDTCWFESCYTQVEGDTYDIYASREDIEGNIGHLLRITNNSFHGVWGSSEKTKYCIREDYSDSLINGNYIDGTNGGYYSGKWYVGEYANARTYGFNNSVNGGQVYDIQSYVYWQIIVGNNDDKTLMVNRLRITDGLTIISNAGRAYSYDNQLYANKDKHAIEWSQDGRYWELMKVIHSGTSPVSGTWRRGDIVLNNVPSAGTNIGWVCVEAGTPGIWKGFGTIGA